MNESTARRLRVAVASGSIGIATLIGWFYVKATDLHADSAHGAPSTFVAATAYSPASIVGTLGGVPVNIPRHFASHVEFDGDQYIAGKPWKPPGPRTQEAELASFGFSVRYPDMVGRSTPELEAEFQKRSIYRTTWMDVGLISGKLFPGAEFLNRRATAINNPWRSFSYVEQPSKENDLIRFVAQGVNPHTNQPYRLDVDAGDVFLYRDTGGYVRTYITCNNSPHEAAPCRQTFSLEPLMKVKVEVGYRRGLLPEWRSIQDSISRLVLGFRVPTRPASADHPASSDAPMKSVSSSPR